MADSRGVPKGFDFSITVAEARRLGDGGSGDHEDGSDGYGAARGRAGTRGRMLALALVLEGIERTTAAETCGMDRQRLR